MKKRTLIDTLIDKKQKIYEVLIQEEDIILGKTNFTISADMVEYLPYFDKGNYVIISYYPYNDKNKKLLYITDTKIINNNYIVSYINKKNLSDSEYNSIITLIDNVSYTKSDIKVESINKKEDIEEVSNIEKDNINKNIEDEINNDLENVIKNEDFNENNNVIEPIKINTTYKVVIISISILLLLLSIFSYIYFG